MLGFVVLIKIGKESTYYRDGTCIVREPGTKMLQDLTTSTGALVISFNRWLLVLFQLLIYTNGVLCQNPFGNDHHLMSPTTLGVCTWTQNNYENLNSHTCAIYGQVVGALQCLVKLSIMDLSIYPDVTVRCPSWVISTPIYQRCLFSRNAFYKSF